jgi:hypothetical protein
LRKDGIKLVALYLRCVIVPEAGSPFHVTDDWIKRAVRVLWGAKVAQTRVRLIGEAFQQRGGEPRFSDAGLA